MIEVQNLTKTFNGKTVIDGISFEVKEGEFFVIFLALFFTKNVISGGYAVSWVAIGAMLVVALLLLALLSYLTRYLNKERIVTTIP